MTANGGESTGESAGPFWSSAKLDPVRKYRFTFTFDGFTNGSKGVWWWAKNVSKPSYEINSNEYQLINHKFKYPGLLTWQDVTITIVDVGSKALQLIKSLEDVGYKPPTSKSKGIEKKKRACLIQQYDAEGKELEKWTLQNAFIKSINFGDLDYSVDDFVEIQITIMYDWAELGSSSAVASGDVSTGEDTKTSNSATAVDTKTMA